jgi:hypothetical protein
MRTHEQIMRITLNERAYAHARRLIDEGRFVLDDRDEWSEHRPSSAQENAHIEANGIEDYARWFLGIDEEQDEESKSRYKFPYGNFARVHRCGVLAAESRSGQYKYFDIERAAAHLHGMLDALMGVQPSV